ncbi:hypothetical protein J7K50_05700 [bacterium]|nr:hypothetical protein [bacterium]
MKINWFGVILVIVGLSIILSQFVGGGWFDFLLRFWPVIFIIRSINNWEREDQTKTFQVCQIALGCVLIASNFAILPYVENVWQFWPVLLIAWGLYVIFGDGRHNTHCYAEVNGARIDTHEKWTGGASEMKTYHLLRELWQETESGDISIEFNAGKLRVGGTTDQFFEGDFRTNLGAPVVEYDAGPAARMKLYQETGSFHLKRHSENTWELDFTNKIPLAFKVKANAGEIDLNLSELKIPSLEFKGNAGKFDIRIGKGEPEVKVYANINAGKATVFVPSDAGVIASGRTAIGKADFSKAGLIKEGGVWITPDFDAASVKVSLEYEVNAGAIEVVRY